MCSPDGSKTAGPASYLWTASLFLALLPTRLWVASSSSSNAAGPSSPLGPAADVHRHCLSGVLKRTGGDSGRHGPRSLHSGPYPRPPWRDLGRPALGTARMRVRSMEVTHPDRCPVGPRRRDSPLRWSGSACGRASDRGRRRCVVTPPRRPALLVAVGNSAQGAGATQLGRKSGAQTHQLASV